MKILARLGHFVGLTILLGFGGGLTLVFGNRKLAGMLWTMLGAGSVGAVFARSTRETLKFDQLHPLSEEETTFLVVHIPFLLLGILLLSMKETRRHYGCS